MPDELPDLQNDQDVDALMSRLSARLAPARRPNGLPATAISTGDPFEALLAADAQCHAATHRVVELIVEWMAESGSMTTVVAMPSQHRHTKAAVRRRQPSKAVRTAARRRRES